MKKPGIPAVPNTVPGLYNVISTLKENVEIMSGVRGGPVSPLPTTASLTDVIAKVNEIIAKLNA